MKVEPPRGSWKAVAIRIGLGLSILAACILLPDLSALPETIGRTDPVWLSAALVLAVVGTILVPSLVTQEALAVDRIDLTLGELVRINFAQRFYVIVLPRAASVGIRWLRYARGGDAHDALALMVYERLAQLFTMTLIGTAVLAAELGRVGDAGPSILAAAVACTVALGAMLVPFVAPAAAGWLAALAGLGGRAIPEFVAARLRRLMDAVAAFHGLRNRANLKVLAYSALAYVLFIASPYAVVVAMDLNISLSALAWIRPLVFLLTMLPFTVGGLGVREAGFIGLLHLYGIAPAEALAFSLTLFAIQVAIGLVGLVVEMHDRLLGDRVAGP
jgi:uncharacterized membrane protein YbhN (UPF0104 family)